MEKTKEKPGKNNKTDNREESEGRTAAPGEEVGSSLWRLSRASRDKAKAATRAGWVQRVLRVLQSEPGTP